MKFNADSPIIFVFVGIIILAVLAQSFYFLFRALKRARQLGMEQKRLKKIMISAALFTIAPAVAILVGIIALSKSLGIPLPWLRLSVIGSLSYETIAAERSLSELGLSTSQRVEDPVAFVTIAWVMTLGIIIGLVLTPLLTKRIQGGMQKIGMKDKKWADVFNNAMFLGMISAFLGYVFCNVSRLWDAGARIGEDGEIFSATSGLVPVCVMAVSALVMAVLGLLSKVLKARVLTDYALPVSLICGMASAVPITRLLG